MAMKGGKGQVGFTQIITIFLVIVFVIIIGLTAVNTRNNVNNFVPALTDSFETVSNGAMTILGPLFKGLLGLERQGLAPENQFLMILTFILISIIVVGTLDSVNIFSGNSQSGLINLAIGIIVSIIGVRFMPTDIWGSLTAPSSAFVATILVGAPFAALFFVTMKVRFPMVGKLLWLFYVLFLSYLIFAPGSVSPASGWSNGFAWIYILFLILSGVMLGFDGTVRRYFYREKGKFDIAKELNEMNVIERKNLRATIAQYQAVVADPHAPQADRDDAQKQIKKLTKMYGDLSKI